MCGINGFNRNDKNLIEKMNVSIQHRGPDDSGVYLDDNMTLGHVRLSIIDLSQAGHQPMFYGDDLILVYNGEIYNYEEMKVELLKKGYTFNSKTDSEVILAAYKEWGVECIKKFNGMFAFAIYDLKKKRVVLTRDRLGIKPLYYFWKDGQLIFSSEIKSILSSDKVLRKPDKKAISSYLLLQTAIGERTFFEDISQLLPGYYAIYDVAKKTLVKKRYFSFDFTEKKDSDPKIYADILKRSVKNQVIGDVPLGTYLSGGFDSGSVTMFSSKILNKDQLHTFTGKYDFGKEFDESKVSQDVAQKAKANLHEITISADDFKKKIEKITYHLDEPARIGQSLGIYCVAEEASKYIKVILAGHGGDELFAGYLVYLARKLEEDLKKGKILSVLSAILKNKNKINLLYHLLGKYYFKELKFGMFSPFSEKFIKDKSAFSLLHKDIKQLYDDELKNIKLSSFDMQQWYNLRIYLPSLFSVEDKASMAHSIESRVPICDNMMIAYALSIPMEKKLKGNETKKIIRDAMKKVLPKSVYTHKKMGFPMPLPQWFTGELNGFLKEKLLSDDCRIKQYVNLSYVKKLLGKRKMNWLEAQRLWTLINLELWLRRWF